MAFYNARNERERRERETPERIVKIAQAKGEFTVSLRYRDDWLRERCAKLKRAGLLRGGKRHGSQLVFYPSTAASAPTGQAQGYVTEAGVDQGQMDHE